MDYKKEIGNLISSIPNINATYFYPKDFKKLPCVSYYVANDSTDVQINNVEYIVNLAIQVDIYTDANKSTTEIAEQIKKKFLSIGFVRAFSQDLQDPSGLNRKTMRFEGKIDLRNNLVYR